MSKPTNEEINALLVQNFDYGSPTTVTTIEQGYLSLNWKIIAEQGSFFLKRYRSALKALDIRSIHHAMRLFGENGIPVINPLPTRARDTVTEIDGRCFSLFPFIDGKRKDRKELEASDLEALGTMLASIHKVGTELPHPAHLPLFNGWDRTAFLEHANKIRGILSSKAVLDDFDRSASEAIEYKLSKVLGDFREPDEFEFTDYAVLHGDFHEGNVFFGETHGITHVFDWEKTCYGPRAFELVRSLNLTCASVEGIGEEEVFRRSKMFFDAYQKTFPIAESEFRTALEFYYVNQFYAVWIERLHYIHQEYQADLLLPESTRRIAFLEQYREEFTRRMFSDTRLFSFIP